MTQAQRRIVAVYAHPDDETSCSGALFAKYAAEGVDLHVVTATRGELGTLGTNGVVIQREDLGAVREAELRAVLKHYGLANPPTLFDYRDQELPLADYQEVVGKVFAHLQQVQPDIVITFGPLGISRHVDHVIISQAATEAFHRYLEETGAEPRLLYVALRKEDADAFELGLDGPDADPNVFVDVPDQWPLKVQALRMYQSQEDAQELANFFEAAAFMVETFHQAYPKLPPGAILRGFWPDSEPAATR